MGRGAEHNKDTINDGARCNTAPFSTAHLHTATQHNTSSTSGKVTVTYGKVTRNVTNTATAYYIYVQYREEMLQLQHCLYRHVKAKILLL